MLHAALRRRGRSRLRWIAEVADPAASGRRIAALGARRRGRRLLAELDLEAGEAARDLGRLLAEADAALRALRAPRPVAPPRETRALPPPVLPPDAWIPETVPGLDGAGIAIGVVDFGFRVDHAAFRRQDGSSRIVALWDQNARGVGPELYECLEGRPFNADYGTVYERSAIGRWLAGEAAPYDPTVGYHDPGMLRAGLHGTHVAALAAGSPFAVTDALGTRRCLSGVAPAADLFLVQLGVAPHDWLDTTPPAPGCGAPPPPRSLSDNERLRDAISWLVCRAVAERRPGLVINLSLATHAGAHDGRSMVEAEIDSLIEALDGKGEGMPMIAVVVCAGNAGATDGHAAIPLAPGGEDGFGWIISRDDETLSELELWHDPAAAIGLTLHAPPHLAAAGFGPWTVGAQEGAGWLRCPGGAAFGWWSHTRHPSGGRPACLGLRIDPALDDAWDRARMLSGLWRIALAHRGGPPAIVHAWVESEQAGQARLAAPPAARRAAWARSTLGSLCCGRHTIVVGAARRTALGGGGFAPWPASGAGPRPWGEAPIDWAEWQDAARPHLCAVGVAAAAAGGLSPHDAVVMDGTSQAAPQVAGAAALIMQDAAARGRRLSAAEIRSALVEGARGRPVRDPFGLDPALAERAGAGVLDPAAAVAAARRR
ncbi:MAG: S8 family serine peptidase [Acetobacteraceae bacterium]|nr:S8 family serine peptidase [Acetobacteraceae bacterium]